MRSEKSWGGEAGFRPGLLGHILIELLLDAFLTEQNPGNLDKYYELVESVDSNRLQLTINTFTTRPTDKLTRYLERYLATRFMFAYTVDHQLVYLVNNVLKTSETGTLR